MNLSNKRILVTGGTGFIGSVIVNKLIEKSCFVNIISRPEDPTWRLEHEDNYEIFKIDLRNQIDVEKCIDIIQPEIIFHLAANVNLERNINIIHEIFSINFRGTQNLILALNKYEYELLINTGTSDEYGNNQAPFNEDVRERPISPYSASKVATTYFCEMIANTYNKPIITVRPFLPFGPKQISRALIPSLIYSCIEKKKLSLTPCEQTRDFIYVDDLADVFISLAINANRVNKMGIFNIGTGKEKKIIEIVNLIKNKFKNNNLLIGDKPYRLGEPMCHFSSINKLKDAIGWFPKWKIEDAINHTIKWWEDNRDIWINYAYLWN